MQTFKAKTIAAAEAAAVKQLGISREMMKVTVTQQPRKGFLGFGRREAVIQVKVKQAAGNQPKTAPAARQPATKKKDVVRPTKRHAQSKPAKQKSVPLDPAEEARRQAEHNHQKNVARMKREATAACDYLVDSLKQLGITATAKPTTIRAHQLTIELNSSKPAAVIGYHGKRINALEELAAAFLDYHGVHDPHLTLDINHYRERRAKTIERLAADCVTEVIATRQAVFLDPMPARERKQLHQLLEKNKQVKTYSHGREPFRSVVVAPAE